MGGRSFQFASACATRWPVSYSANRQPVGITAYLAGRKPNVPDTSVCTQCKRRGLTCVMVAHGTPCLGPVTHAGCGALCPAVGRGCYGCFGPMTGANLPALTRQLHECGMTDRTVDLVLSTYNTTAFAAARDAGGRSARASQGL